MKIFRDWTFKWWEIALLKICLLSLGALVGIYLYYYFANILWLLWMIFLASGVYFIVRLIREK